jgi:iron(III) transport system substrate-binding protein
MTSVMIDAVTGNGEEGRVHAYSAFEPYELSDYMGGLAEALPGIAVSIERMSTAALIDRLQREGSVAEADIVFGWADTALRMQGLGAAVPRRDAFVRPTGFSTALIVDPAALERLGAPMPRQWADLLHPALEGAIAFPDPRQSGAGFLATTTLLQHYGEDEGWELLSGIDAQAGANPGSAWTPAALTGEGDIAVGVTVRIAAVKRRSEDQRLRVVEPEDVTGAEAEVYGPLGNGRSAAAEKVLAWVTSDAARPFFERYHKIDLRQENEGVLMIDAERAVVERKDVLSRYTMMKEARRAAEKVVPSGISRGLR